MAKHDPKPSNVMPLFYSIVKDSNVDLTVENWNFKILQNDFWTFYKTKQLIQICLLFNRTEFSSGLKWQFSKTWLDNCMYVCMYSVVHISIPPRFLLEIRVIIKISKKFLVSHKLWLIWIRMKQKNFFFLKKKIQNGRLKKTEFFNYPQKLSNCRQNFTDWSLG